MCSIVRWVFDFPSVLRRLRHAERRLSVLEYRMSAVDDVIAELDTATNEIASDLTRLRDEVAAGNTGTAAKFQPLLDRLTALGQDPANPVPTTPGA